MWPWTTSPASIGNKQKLVLPWLLGISFSYSSQLTEDAKLPLCYRTVFPFAILVLFELLSNTQNTSGQEVRAEFIIKTYQQDKLQATLAIEIEIKWQFAAIKWTCNVLNIKWRQMCENNLACIKYFYRVHQIKVRKSLLKTLWIFQEDGNSCILLNTSFQNFVYLRNFQDWAIQPTSLQSLPIRSGGNFVGFDGKVKMEIWKGRSSQHNLAYEFEIRKFFYICKILEAKFINLNLCKSERLSWSYIRSP